MSSVNEREMVKRIIFAREQEALRKEYDERFLSTIPHSKGIIESIITNPRTGTILVWALFIFFVANLIE